MTITLNEQALRFLLEDEGGPVGLDLRRRAQNITDLYRTNVVSVMPRFPASEVDFEITTGDEGLQAIIGIRGGGTSARWADYLAAKVEREPEKATNAVAQGNHP
jgi:hypothetical protein